VGAHRRLALTWNSHDALVAALREVERLLERLGSSGGLAAVRAALALASPR
jgi:hypothetical protein